MNRSIEGQTLSALIVVVAVSSAFGVEIFRRWALRRRILDQPNERSSHIQPVPRGAGLVIAGCSLAVALLVTLTNRAATSSWLAMIATAALIAGISWVDDLRGLPVRVRLGAHAFSAAVVLAAAGPLSFSPWLELPRSVAIAITILWIVGLTNAFNFMDGIDGIAASQSTVWGTFLAISALASAANTTAIIAGSIAAASAGFLVHNWSPARVFMGDVGSAYLGFVFAVLPLMERGSMDPLATLVVTWPFVFDTSFTFLRRLTKREPVFSAHRSHLYQRMVIAGRSHRQVAAFYAVWSIVGGIIALRPDWPALRLTFLIASAALTWLIVVSLERSARRRSLDRSRA